MIIIAKRDVKVDGVVTYEPAEPFPADASTIVMNGEEYIVFQEESVTDEAVLKAREMVGKTVEDKERIADEEPLKE